MRPTEITLCVRLTILGANGGGGMRSAGRLRVYQEREEDPGGGVTEVGEDCGGASVGVEAPARHSGGRLGAGTEGPRASTPPLFFDRRRSLLFSGNSAADTRTHTPGVGAAGHGEPANGQPSAVWLQASRRLAAQTAPRHVLEADRDRYAAVTSLREFWGQCEAGALESIGRRSRSRATRQKERQSLNRWERFSRPEAWPAGEPWPGPAIGDVTTGLLAEVFGRAAAAGLAADTVKSLRSHLRTLFNHAVAVRALRVAPVFPAVDAPAKKVRIWSPEEIESIYRGLAEHSLLQAAFVLACNAGPRPCDLFLFRWEDVTPPPASEGRADRDRETDGAHSLAAIEWTSRKTGKRQCVPLAPCTWRHLERIRPLGLLAESAGYVFPGLASPHCADSEKSREARRRNRTMRAILERLGIRDARKPWQICRATCNERYESHALGVGQFLLGHALSGVNARSYREPSAHLRHAVLTLPQPVCFARGGGRVQNGVLDPG